MSTERAERMARAKRPRSPLAGSYGHPVHPILVTVPIGAWVASLVFDLMAAFGDEPEVFARGAYWLVVIGIVGALLAALAGLLAVPYAVSIAPYRDLTDADCERSNPAWRRFIWLNLVTGFLVTQLLIWIALAD